MFQSVPFHIKGSANVASTLILRLLICSITTMASSMITILCVLFGVASTYAKPPIAIVGGDVADDNEFPYQVSLRIYSQHICGGSILDSTHILTAAHCIEDASKMMDAMTVMTSSNNRLFGGKIHKVKKLTVHPKYRDSAITSWRNDIAIITLSTPITLDSRAKPVKLPTENPADGISAIATGWGNHLYNEDQMPVHLRKLEMKLISHSECSKMGPLYESHICAFKEKGSGICSGDSGGPLVENGKIIGVASYVIPCGKGYPDVFTNVWKFVDWIKQIMNE